MGMNKRSYHEQDEERLQRGPRPMNVIIVYKSDRDHTKNVLL